jgi:hypothetical protein
MFWPKMLPSRNPNNSFNGFELQRPVPSITTSTIVAWSVPVDTSTITQFESLDESDPL